MNRIRLWRFGLTIRLGTALALIAFIALVANRFRPVGEEEAVASAVEELRVIEPTLFAKRTGVTSADFHVQAIYAGVYDVWSISLTMNDRFAKELQCEPTTHIFEVETRRPWFSRPICHLYYKPD